MSRKLLVISISGFFILAFTNLSWGWIGGKYFDMSETIKIKMTVKKAGSASDTGTGYDTFYFGGGGSFYMDNMDMSGAWSQVKKKFTVTIPYGDIEYYMHSVLDLALDEALSYECWDYEGDFSGITHLYHLNCQA